MSQQPSSRNPWSWIPTLYLFEGIPYSIVMTTSGLIYKTMGISVSALAFWTSLLYLPWAIKPLWSPYVEVVSTKRTWIIVTQIMLGLAFIVTGSVMPVSIFFPLTIGLFAITAILSASHDIAADGFYMHALDQHKQTFFVGIRSTFYRIAMLTAMGAIPLVAGLVQEKTGLKPVTLKVSALPVNQEIPVITQVPQQAHSSEEPSILLLPEEVRLPLSQKSFSQKDSSGTFIMLSASPEKDETIVLNLAFKSGSKNIRLAGKQTGRYEFTAENWNQPVFVAFVVDRNLKTAASAMFKVTAGNIAFSWSIALGVLGLFLLLLGIYHKFMLPSPAEVKTADAVNLKVYADVFISFFKKPGIVPALLFFLFYRFGEAQSIKIATPFLVDSRGSGGIGLTAAQYGIAYGTIGMISLTIGGILGGICAAKYGLKRLIWLMAISMNLPNIGLLYIAITQPLPGDMLVYTAIVLEQFGYGFGFTAYMLFMLHFVGDSKYKTAEYAIGTSLMALGMMLPGMISGYVQEWLGYQHFFVYVLLCTLPGMAIIPFLKIDREFGIKKK
jgi:PAT family beta-lactamase induction signal transducer AmpG